MKKALALTLAAALSASLLAGCGGSGSSTSTAAGGGDAATAEQTGLPAYNELTVGEDYTDLTANIKFISHRTDLIEVGTFDGYVAAFNEL